MLSEEDLKSENPGDGWGVVLLIVFIIGLLCWMSTVEVDCPDCRIKVYKSNER